MSLYRPTYTVTRPDGAKETRTSDVWWYEFAYQGGVVRQSAKTSRKTIAAAAEKDHRRRLERVNAGMPTEDPGQRIRTVAAVLKEYEAEYGINHRDNSLVVVTNRSKHLVRVLGALLLPDVNQGRLIAYMNQRRQEEASNRTINLELIVLSRAMGHTWKALWPKLKKLEENRDAGQALEPEQEAAVLAAAANNPSKLIYPFLMTLTWTGIRSDECRMLRWNQLDFDAPEVTVGKSKTEAGKGRVIPMSGPLKAALEQHAAFCASRLGPLRPEWYVFPMSNRTRPVDGTRPVSSLKTAWETVKTEAGVKCRLHDLRHSFCTKLAEKGTPEATMLDMMGHVSPAMLRRYSHIRAQARRDAIAALEGRGSFGVLQEPLQVDDAGKKQKPATH